FVAGEDAGGVHGANRLGGNGVANSTVYGGVAGDEMARYLAAGPGLPEPDPELLEAEVDRALHPFLRRAGNVNELREQLMDVMWEDAGILRTDAGLSRCLARLAELKQAIDATGIGNGDRVFNMAWHDWLHLRNLADVSE